MNDEGDFLLADKHERFLQIDTLILMEMFKYCQSSQNSKFAVTLQHLKKEVRDESDFLHADKHQSFLQFDFNNLGIKISYKVILSLLMGMIRYPQRTQCNKYLLSLQYLKEEVRHKTF